MINQKEKARSAHIFNRDSLSGFSMACLKALEVPEQQAETVTDCLLYADFRGHPSHGIVRLPVYGKRLLSGAVNAVPKIHVVSEQTVSAVIDGDNGLGPVVGQFAMEHAIALAMQHGVGFVVCRKTNHFGSAAFYTEMAVRKQCIGVAASNAPPNMAPYGGRDRFLGTNPLSVGVPAGKFDPVVFDMASSVVARGKIILAAQRGEPIPEGWALDPNGNPTTDANLGLLGPVLPFGGMKGSAISLLIDIFSGVLSGASYGRRLNTLEDLDSIQNLGHFFLVIAPSSFMDMQHFQARMDDLITQLKQTPLAPGFKEILAPGEVERRTMKRIQREGITITDDVYLQLIELATSLQVPEPADWK